MDAKLIVPPVSCISAQLRISARLASTTGALVQFIFGRGISKMCKSSLLWQSSSRSARGARAEKAPTCQQLEKRA